MTLYVSSVSSGPSRSLQRLKFEAKNERLFRFILALALAVLPVFGHRNKMVVCVGAVLV